MDTREIILNVENLNTTFISDKKKIHIVKDVSFQVKRGKTLAVVGESGCGKSVTMNSVMRFLGRNAIVEAKSIQYNALKNGEVKEYHLEQVKNKDINGSMMRELRGPDMAMVFQDPMSSLNPVYKVGNQVAEGFLQHNRGMTKKQAREKVLEMFRKLGIPDPEERIDCYPHQFSGGMKQRVVIAIALACKPELLIADEPTTALDVTIQATILELIQDIQRKKDLSVIYITHDLGVVAKVADFVNVMYAGKIIETGTINEIFYDPRHPYTWGLLSSMPDLDTDDDELYTIPGTPPNLAHEIKGDAFAPRNQFALNIDLRVEPPMFDVPGSNSHKVASWLMHEKAPKVEMPETLKKRIEKMKEEGLANGK